MNQGFIGWSQARPSVTIAPVREFTVNTPIASVTLDVPQGFEVMRLQLTARGDTAATSTTIFVQFNGDTGANYDYTFTLLSGATTSGSSARAAAANAIGFGFISAATAPASTFSPYTIRLSDYTSTVSHKHVLGTGAFKDGAVATTFFVTELAGWWRPTVIVPISSMTFTLGAGNFLTGSVFRLYGE